VSWPALFTALILVGIGAEALWLSRARSSLPQTEIDKLVFGNTPPQLSEQTRSLLEREVVVRSGRSTRVVGIALVVLGLTVGAFGAGLL
jgi:hypothetical protein